MNRCEESDKLINQVAANNSQYSFVKIDTGIVDLAKKYF